MKVVHLTSVHPPFDTRIFRKECRSLARIGYTVTLIAPHDRDEIVDGVQIRAIPKPSSRLRRMLVTTRQVYGQAVELEADIYHFHDPELIPLGLLLRGHGYKVIYDVHENLPLSLFTSSKAYLPHYTKPLLSRLIGNLEKFASSKFSAIIAATPTIGSRFQALNSRTYVINNFPIIDELVSPTEIRWSSRPHSVAYVGGISMGRGLQQMVESIGHLPNDIEVRLKLAGHFSSSQSRERVAKLPSWQQVDELGFIDRKKMANLLGQVQAGLILFHPEPNHIDAQPNKLFEYMSAGIPLIASDFPLWRKLIQSVGCGLLVDPLDPKAIAVAIEYILRHPTEAEAMGNRGRKAIETHFNWKNEKKQLLRLYKELL